MEYNTRPLTKEEGDALTKELQEVLAKHGAEMGVTSAIQLMKRVDAPVPSQFAEKETNGQSDDTNSEKPKEEADSQAESGS